MTSATLTIHQALAEAKRITEKLGARHNEAGELLCRPNITMDPHGEGGSEAKLQASLNSTNDLALRLVMLRVAVMQSNMESGLTVEGESRTVFAWLTWRRDVAPRLFAFWKALQQREADSVKWERSMAGQPSEPNKPTPQLVWNLPLGTPSEQVERIGDLLSALDGALQTHNATATITVD